jgi:hypothetical protein
MQVQFKNINLYPIGQLISTQSDCDGDSNDDDDDDDDDSEL